MNQTISDNDLAGAIEMVDKLVSMLKEVHALGLAPSIEEMCMANVNDVDDVGAARVLVRTSLMLAVALAKLADQ